MVEKTQSAPEKQTEAPTKNCAGCNKPVQKLKRYYRNGKYYCNKACFKKTKTKKTA